jgi:hypothetical protein
MAGFALSTEVLVGLVYVSTRGWSRFPSVLLQGVKDDALRHALFLNRPEFVELAVAHGSSIAAIPFFDVLMTGDRALVAALRIAASLLPDLQRPNGGL